MPGANLGLNDVKNFFLEAQKNICLPAGRHKALLRPTILAFLDLMTLSDDDAAWKNSGSEQRIIGALTRSRHGLHVLTVQFLPIQF